MKKDNLAIIGGGASGLVAGIVALRRGLHVSVFEKNSKLARKILATGNGRCNVTNQNIDISRFHGQDVEFACKAFSKFTCKDCEKFFESIGIKLIKNGDKYFPMSLQASSISESLIYEFQALGGEVFTDTFVSKVIKKDDTFILHANTKTKSFNKLLIATGSGAMPKLGSSSSGYDIAKFFGHKITPTFPSLVQLACKEDSKQASGVKFEAEVSLHANGELKICTFGDLLITSYGVSGSAILDVSREASLGLIEGKKVEVFVDCINGYTKEFFSNQLREFSRKFPKKPLILLLNGFINKKLALYILNRCKISPKKLAYDLTKKEINSIIFTLKNLKFSVIDTKGIEFAEVVSGGVATKDINPQTLESNLVKNLYFSGEVLDIDGDCGGFNLHWAWASGFCVGNSMTK